MNKAIYPIAAIIGIQLLDLLTGSQAVRARDPECPGYQFGDVNRWAEQQGRALRHYRPGALNQWAEQEGRALRGDEQTYNIQPAPIARAPVQQSYAPVQRSYQAVAPAPVQQSYRATAAEVASPDYDPIKRDENGKYIIVETVNGQTVTPYKEYLR